MHLHPFTLTETETYLHRRGVTLDRYDVVQTYMLTGGVAYYLSYFQPGLSLAENIDAVFFAENGFLQTEYDRLFTSLFADNEVNPSSNRTYWYDNQNSPKLNSWRGRAFEDVCFVHQAEVKRALGISGVQAEVYPWHATADGGVAGAQIDMLIDRADRVLNLCEMKFSQDDFVISKDYDERLRRKIVRLQEETGGKRNVQVTLVTTFGLKRNMYSSRVQRVVTLDGLFG